MRKSEPPESRRAWKTISRETVYEHQPYIKVENHSIELPDGARIKDWAWIISPDYVNIVAITQYQKCILFRQNKYSIEGDSLAPAGGYVEIGEEPLCAAKRELLEETGYRADEWRHLGSYVVDGNRGAGNAHLFLATGATRVCDPVPDDLEDQILVELSLQEVKDALLRHEFRVLPWATAISLSLHLLQD